MISKTKLVGLIVISSFIGFFSATSISQVAIRQSDQRSLVQDSSNIASNQKFLGEIISKVKSDYVDTKTDQEIYESAAKGILSSLDPHSSYMDADSLRDMKVQTKGEFGGVGIEITMEFSTVKIISPIDGTPAQKAGLKSGDYIIKVDGKSIVGLSIEEAVKKLRGKPGSKVKVILLRKGEKDPIEKVITREVIKVKAVKSEKFGKVGYLKINTFSEQTSRGIQKEIARLKRKIGADQLKGLILDLRNNPGGLLSEAVKVSDFFLSKNQLIVSIKGRDDSNKIYKDGENEKLIKGLPIVVLINEGSASASEIVAGALQDNNRAVIMGNKSFGKGSVQTVIPLQNNQGAIRLTTSLYYTPSGKSIQAYGIEPDIEVTDAKIQSNQTNGNSEADLVGHIESKIKSHQRKTDKEKLKDDNIEMYDEDYQLARALDLIRGLSVYKLNR